MGRRRGQGVSRRVLDERDLDGLPGVVHGDLDLYHAAPAPVAALVPPDPLHAAGHLPFDHPRLGVAGLGDPEPPLQALPVLPPRLARVAELLQPFRRPGARDQDAPEAEAARRIPAGGQVEGTSECSIGAGLVAPGEPERPEPAPGAAVPALPGEAPFHAPGTVPPSPRGVVPDLRGHPVAFSSPRRDRERGRREWKIGAQARGHWDGSPPPWR